MPTLRQQIAAHAEQSRFKLPENMSERARLLKLACASAAAMERAKLAGGLPASKPAPWPESTWRIMAEHAQYHVK